MFRIFPTSVTSDYSLSLLDCQSRSRATQTVWKLQYLHTADECDWKPLHLSLVVRLTKRVIC